MKRFWKITEAVEVDGRWGVALDGRAVQTPARAPLLVPSEALGLAITAEWDAQTEKLAPATMPLTGLANAAIDIADSTPSALAESVAAYAQTDLLCYRDDRDPDLQAEQAAAWNPTLSWAERHYGVEFTLAHGVLPVDQPPATVAALRAAVFEQPSFRLAPLSPLTTIGGSLVAGLALIEGAFTAEHLWDVVSLDELYQERRWGSDSEAQMARAKRESDWSNAARFLALL